MAYCQGRYERVEPPPPEVEAAWKWLAEMLLRPGYGISRVTEAEFGELAAWFAENAERLERLELPARGFDLGGGWRTGWPTSAVSQRVVRGRSAQARRAEKVRRLKRLVRRGPAVKMRNRLRRLEQAVPDPGCPACRGRRGRIVLTRARRLADGTLASPEGRPGPCGRCGKVAEFIIEVVEPLVDGPEVPGTRVSVLQGGQGWRTKFIADPDAAAATSIASGLEDGLSAA